MYNQFNMSRQLIYRPVTAYTADGPIIVNGVNINTGLYPVLNYQPAGASFPYIYVPIAEFAKVGAVVVWDETNQVLTVETDYYETKSLYAELESNYSKAQETILSLRRIIRDLRAENEKLKEQLAGS